jgi:maleate cis-trans isomerase
MAYEPVLPRARIGFIIPASNRMVEPQMQRFMPAGVIPHFTRLYMRDKPLETLLPQILESTMLLAESKCDVTVLQCTGTSMSGGVEAEHHMIAEMEKRSGRPALSAASSLTAAFQALRAKRLVFVSETTQPGHDKKLRFLREAGYDIVADKAASLAGTDAFCSTPPRFWYDTVMALRRDEADAYFISCANIHSIDVIEDLERELKKPVVTSNQAALWRSLRTARIRDSVPGLGVLLHADYDVGRAAAE